MTEAKDIKVLNLFIFLLCLTSVNRTLSPFGIDLRIIVVLLGVFIIAYSLKKYGLNTVLSNISSKRFIILYLFSIISSLWIFINFDKVNVRGLSSLVVLHISILISAVVINIQRDKIKFEKVYRFLTISMMILFFSMIFVYMTKNIKLIGDHRFLGYVTDNNFIGTNIRVGGYAQDPNQASIWIVMFIIITFFYINNIFLKSFLISLSVLMYLLAASKTVLLGSIVTLFISVIFAKLIKSKKYNLLYFLKIIGIYVAPIILILIITIDFNYLPFSNLDTMRTRYIMWDEAVKLFKTSPIFGVGLSGFRNNYGIKMSWYVQSHSTIFQLVSEVGIAGLLLYLSLISENLNNRSNTVRTLTIMMYITSITLETMYLPILLFIEMVKVSLDKKAEGINKSSLVIVTKNENDYIRFYSSSHKKREYENTFLISLYEFENISEDVVIKKLLDRESNKFLGYFLSRIRLNKIMMSINFSTEIDNVINISFTTQLLAFGSYLNNEAIYGILDIDYLANSKKQFWRKLNLLLLKYSRKVLVIDKDESSLLKLGVNPKNLIEL
uniref:O-antigen ligase family protein n=1 Tax=Erysipelothrix tonsillarum TaxID=38402 RepID=A0A6S6I2M5_9FIRM|nr:O-antigen ligase family protein [Erysipelothrix tonsillarum]